MGRNRCCAVERYSVDFFDVLISYFPPLDVNLVQITGIIVTESHFATMPG